MKWFIIAFLLTSTWAVNAQQKKDNVILIHTGADAETNYNQFAKYLAQNGYSFTMRDAELLQMTTEFKKSVRGNVPYSLIITCADHVIYVRAKWETISMAYTPMVADWFYTTSRSSLPTKVWESFEPVLRGFGSLTYQRE